MIIATRRTALSLGQRKAPPIEALWYQAWRLSAKGWSTKKAKAPDKSSGQRRLICCPLIFHHSSRKKIVEFNLQLADLVGELKVELHALQASPTSAPYKFCFSRQ
jgi:hypothetical protein